MQVEVRPYQETDFESVAAIWINSWKSTGVVTARTPSSLRDRLKEEVANGRAIHVAMTDSTVVGFVALYEGRLEQLFVTPEAQSHGVGKQLLNFAKALNPNGLWLTMTAANERAARFYEREGLKRGETSLHPRHGHQIVRYDWLP